MEIERKYIIHEIPVDLSDYRSRHMEQAYVSVKPVIRIRRVDDEAVLTVKSKGLLSRQEFELELSDEEYLSLKSKTEGNVIEKDRYVIPLAGTDGSCGGGADVADLYIELDVFCGLFEGLVYAEVEFPSEEAANAFTPPSWFGEDVTEAGIYQNSALSRMPESDILEFVRSVRMNKS